MATVAPQPKRWLGKQTHCDLCNSPLTTHPHFYDARLLSGRWAIVCQDCFDDSTRGIIGTGFAQQYSSDTKLKTKG